MSWIKYVFVDESGDLGKYGSKYFIVAAIVVNNPKHLSRIIKKIRNRKLKKKLKELRELKATKTNDHIRKAVLKKVSETDCEIFAIVVEKKKIMPRLYDAQNRLYNYLIAILLKQIEKTSGKLEIVVDRKHTNTLIRRNFNSYIEYKINQVHPDLEISVRHLESHSRNELQVIDFVTWSIFRKFNWGDCSYYNIIEDKIVNKEDMLLWQ